MSCCDILVVYHGNGVFTSSPFFVQFSKKAKQREIVEIHVTNEHEKRTAGISSDSTTSDGQVPLGVAATAGMTGGEVSIKSDLYMVMDPGMKNAYFYQESGIIETADMLEPVERMASIPDHPTTGKTKQDLAKTAEIVHHHNRLHHHDPRTHGDDEQEHHHHHHHHTKSEKKTEKRRLKERIRNAQTSNTVLNSILKADKRLERMKLDMIYHPRMLTPTSGDIERLGLCFGLNKVRFVKRRSNNNNEQVEEAEESIEGNIFLFHKNEKLILCDVDGTITKTDLRGIFMVNVAKYYGYTHPGIASLLTAIADQGYKVVYLTARAITQGEKTRKFIQHIEQEKINKMPLGPIITSYNTFMHAALREYLYGRSDTFKVGALKMLRDLFPCNESPFVAGFGNKISDHKAYLSVGIPVNRIFIIDKDGHVNKLTEHSYESYNALKGMMGSLFPPIADKA